MEGTTFKVFCFSSLMLLLVLHSFWEQKWLSHFGFFQFSDGVGWTTEMSGLNQGCFHSDLKRLRCLFIIRSLQNKISEIQCLKSSCGFWGCPSAVLCFRASVHVKMLLDLCRFAPFLHLVDLTLVLIWAEGSWGRGAFALDEFGRCHEWNNSVVGCYVTNIIVSVRWNFGVWSSH